MRKTLNMDLNHDACYLAITQRDARFDGRLFTGVKTTGIYCRPICPARTPLSKNVVFFSTAAAAQEAGFRPCLRCRPEAAPGLGAARGTFNTVSRALALIEQGTLDDDNEEHLAERLGLGARQLRRLFKRHLGASPAAVARTRRVLLARQLIEETRLPMAELAFAAGFGSVRQFNETFLRLYGRPPRELRRSRRVELPLVDHGALELTLAYLPPYDWEAMLGFLSLRAIPGVEVVGAGSWRRTLELDGAEGTVSVRHGEGHTLVAVVQFPVLGALPEIIARLRRVFDLGADPVAIDACLSADATLAPLVVNRPGLRAPGAWDGFELAIRAVLGQQITVAAARKLAGELVKRHGRARSNPTAGLTHLFPTPRSLAEAEIRGMPGARARTLSAVARAVIARPDVLETARDLAEAVDRLTAIPGVGRWTAQYIALRQLREPDAFPSSDVGLMRAAAGPTGQRPTAVELEARSLAWSPWRAYAAQHLWTSLGLD